MFFFAGLLHGFVPLGIYLGAIGAFLLSIFWKPEIGLYYLVPLLPMQTVRYWIHAFPLGEKIVDVLLLGVLIGLFFRAERPLFISSPLNKVLLVFVGFTYLSLWQGAFYLGTALPLDPADPRFSDWKNYVEMFFLFFIAAAAIRKPRQIAIMIALMCFSVLVVNRSYHGEVGDRDFSHYSDELRDAGTLGYAGENGMGAFQAEFAVFLLGLAGVIEKRYIKLGLWAIAVTCIYCLALTFSRGAYLGFLVGLLILGLTRQRKFLVVLAILLVSWQSFVPGAVRDRILMTYSDNQGLESSAQERVTIWQDAETVIDHDPIFGTGFDTYKFMGRVGPYQDTHNYYIKVLLELGAVGMLIFLCLLGAAWRTSWRLYRAAEDPMLKALGAAVLAMVACAMVVNFFGDRWSYLQVNAFFWVLLGLAARGYLLIPQAHTAPGAETSDLAVTAAETSGVFAA